MVLLFIIYHKIILGVWWNYDDDCVTKMNLKLEPDPKFSPQSQQKEIEVVELDGRSSSPSSSSSSSSLPSVNAGHESRKKKPNDQIHADKSVGKSKRGGPKSKSVTKVGRTKKPQNRHESKDEPVLEIVPYDVMVSKHLKLLRDHSKKRLHRFKLSDEEVKEGWTIDQPPARTREKDKPWWKFGVVLTNPKRNKRLWHCMVDKCEWNGSLLSTDKKIMRHMEEEHSQLVKGPGTEVKIQLRNCFGNNCLC